MPPHLLPRTEEWNGSGFAAEITDQLARNAGLSVQNVFEDAWSDMIARVLRGEADVIPGMGVSEERRQELDFTDPIDAFPFSLCVQVP